MEVQQLKEIFSFRKYKISLIIYILRMGTKNILCRKKGEGKFYFYGPVKYHKFPVWVYLNSELKYVVSTLFPHQ